MTTSTVREIQYPRLETRAPSFAHTSPTANLTVTGDPPLLTATSTISDERCIVAMGTACKCVSEY